MKDTGKDTGKDAEKDVENDAEKDAENDAGKDAGKDDYITFPEHMWDKQTKELRSAIYDDWKRKAINDAKFRAVEQNVDYSTFANLVWLWNSRCALTRANDLGCKTLQLVSCTLSRIVRDFGHG